MAGKYQKIQNMLFVTSFLLITAPLTEAADAVTDWNQRAGDIVVNAKIGPLPAERALAIVQASVYEAVNAITQRYAVQDTKLQAAPGYADAFTNADAVIIPSLTKLKTDPTDPEPPFDGKFLRDIIAKTHDNAIFIENDNEVIQYIEKNLKKEDVVVFLGSHGFRGMIEEVISDSNERKTN